MFLDCWRQTAQSIVTAIAGCGAKQTHVPASSSRATLRQGQHGETKA
jgi:hypothetical protein